VSCLVGVLSIASVSYARDKYPRPTDIYLQSEVQSVLDRDPEIHPSADIWVSANGQQVELGGIVENWSEHYAATQDAFLAGAQSVSNHIRVREAPLASNQTFFYERKTS
jgi:osmotically-inducible protein OsmY